MPNVMKTYNFFKNLLDKLLGTPQPAPVPVRVRVDNRNFR